MEVGHEKRNQTIYYHIATSSAAPPVACPSAPTC